MEAFVVLLQLVLVLMAQEACMPVSAGVWRAAVAVEVCERTVQQRTTQSEGLYIDLLSAFVVLLQLVLVLMAQEACMPVSDNAALAAWLA